MAKCFDRFEFFSIYEKLHFLQPDFLGGLVFGFRCSNKVIQTPKLSLFERVNSSFFLFQFLYLNYNEKTEF